MALASPVRDALSQLINEFQSNSSSLQKDSLQRKLTVILKDQYQGNSDLATHGHFEGLEEKSRILQNDKLADALVERYETLKQWHNRWKYDFLSFLLQLADNPIDETRLEDLKDVIPAPLSPNLTWNDLIKYDPYEDKAIWQNINYVESSSDESEWSMQTSNEAQDQDQHSKIDSLGENTSITVSRAPTNDEELDILIAARADYLQDSNKLHLTETQLIRETLFMLYGLPSSIYKEDLGQVRTCGVIVIDGLTVRMIDKLLKPFCKFGSTLKAIRDTLELTQNEPVLQCFQACLLELVHTFHTDLSVLERQIIQSNGPAVTLLSAWSTIAPKFKPLEILSLALHRQSSQLSYFILDTLYDLVVREENLGDGTTYQTMIQIFNKCLNVYIRPVNAWMEHGSLEASFFIKYTKHEALDTSVWQDQFQLDFDDEDSIRAPAFLQPFVRKIFVVGKGVNLLNRIDPTQTLSDKRDNLQISPEMICGNENFRLQSFEDTLASALESWITDKCEISGKQVLNMVIRKGKLQEVLLAIQHIYFFKDGAASQQIAYSIFKRIDGNKRWLDKFLLNDLFQEHLAMIPNIDIQGITTRISRDSDCSIPMRSVRELGLIHLDYCLPWVAGIVLQTDHMQVLQAISVLLLQLKRAGQLLDRFIVFRVLVDSKSAQQKLILLLGQRLRWFVDTLYFYITTAVLDTSIQQLYSHLHDAKDLDDLITTFDDTILSLSTSCILDEQQGTTHNAIISLLDLAVRFSDLCASISSEASPSRDAEKIANKIREQRDEKNIGLSRGSTNVASETEKILIRYRGSFEQLLSFIIAGIQSTTRTSQQSQLQVLLDNLKFGVVEK